MHIVSRLWADCEQQSRANLNEVGKLFTMWARSQYGEKSKRRRLMLGTITDEYPYFCRRFEKCGGCTGGHGAPVSREILDCLHCVLSMQFGPDGDIIKCVLLAKA